MIVWTLGVLGLLIVAFALLSPLESLRWWADKGEREVRSMFESLPPIAEPRRTEGFVVYLSGVGTISGDAISAREHAWLGALAKMLPNHTIVGDVFPYSTENRGLLQRATVWLWSTLDRAQRKPGLKVLASIINLRNVLQVLVSADPRYGPTQSIGLAQEIWRSVQRHGYMPGSETPITLIGFSGGGQMALGAGWFLAGLGAPVELISVGGLFGDDPGLDRMRHVWHFCRAHAIGCSTSARLPSGRWPTAPLST